MHDFHEFLCVLLQTLFLFGRDVSQIPCFRESFLNGIIGGVAIGLGTFMRTSRPRQACNYAIGSQTLITLLYWSYCRYVSIRLFANKYFGVALMVFLFLYFMKQQVLVVKGQIYGFSNTRGHAATRNVPGNRRGAGNERRIRKWAVGYEGSLEKPFVVRYLVELQENQINEFISMEWMNAFAFAVQSSGVDSLGCEWILPELFC